MNQALKEQEKDKDEFALLKLVEACDVLKERLIQKAELLEQYIDKIEELNKKYLTLVRERAENEAK